MHVSLWAGRKWRQKDTEKPSDRRSVQNESSLDHFCVETYYNDARIFEFHVAVLAAVEDRILHHPDAVKRQVPVAISGDGIDSYDRSLLNGLRDSVDEGDEEPKFHDQWGDGFYSDDRNTCPGPPP